MRRLLMGGLLLLAGCASGGSGGGAAPGNNQLTPQETAAGWISLFDGQTLEGWTNRGTAQWRVVDGNLNPLAGTGQGHLATQRSFRNFRMLADVWAHPTSNSGIYFRVPETEPATVDNSWEVQIFDDGPVWQTGAIVNLAAARVKVPSAGRWSTLDITAVGDHFTVLVNGVEVVDTVAPMPRLPAGPIILGPVGQGEIRFRNLKLLPM